MSDPKTTPVARMQAEGRNPGDGGETGAPDSAALHPGYGTNRPLNELADINPTVSLSGLLPESEVSFIPMADASENGQWTNRQTRRLKEVRNGYTSFQDGDVLFAKITPCMENGKGCHATSLVNGVGFGSTEFHVLRAREGQSQRYIYHWTRSEELRRKAETMMTGSAGQRRVPTEFFSRFVVFSPAEAVQRRIAEILDTLDDAIQKTEQLIAKLKQIKQGLLHDLLTRGIDENGQLRDPIAHPEQFKDSLLGKIPLEWSVLSVASVAADIPHAIVDGPFGSNLKTEHYREKGVPVIQSGFVTSGEFQADSYVYVDQSLVEAQKRSIARPGDIIMAKIGAQCGACAVMPDRHPEGILAGNSLKISLDGSVCRTQYALKVLHYYRDTGVLDLIKTETAQPAISLRNLKSLLLPIPSVDEQNRIIAVLNAQDRRKLEEIKSLSKLLEVRKGLMRDLLTGKVRAPVRKELKNVW